MLMYSFGINAFGIRSEQLNVSLAEDSLKKKKKKSDESHSIATSWQR